MAEKGMAYSGKAVFTHLAGLLGAFLALLAASSLLLGSYTHRQQDGSVIVNAAGLQRMLMTRYAYNAQDAALSGAARDGKSAAEARAAAQDVRRIIDANFDGFLDTGRIFPSQDGKRAVTVQTFAEPAIREKILAARGRWEELKKAADGVFRPQADDGAATSLHAGMDKRLIDAVKAQDDAVHAIASSFAASNRQLVSLQMGALAAGIVTFLLSLAYAWFHIARRIDKSLAEVEAANAAKSNFLAHMSHELRTPMNSILGMTRLLCDDESLSPDHREMIKVAYRAADSLLNILNDILDISKVEAQELKLESLPFALQEVSNDIMETMMPISSSKGLRLSCAFSGDDIPYLVGDPLRVGRIMMNLIGNAVKYTEQGGVKVSIRGRKIDDSHVEVTLAVSDTGIGIAADRVGAVFDRFAQADASMTRRFGGTGLGLSITKQLVEMMGGAIGVESELGKGSVFTAVIPFETSPVRPVVARQVFHRDPSSFLPEEQRRPLMGARLLLVEDHALNEAYMRKLFQREAIDNYDFARNGAEALDLYRKNAYDAIITDCHMPEMSGYDFSRKVRESEKGTDRRIPIIAMTADAMMGSREKCFAAGMDDFVSKPIDPDELNLVFSRWFTLPEKKKPEDGGKGAPAGVIDLAALAQFAGEGEDIRPMIGIFLDQSDGMIGELRATCTDGESAAWSETAHKLKGGAAMLGAKKLAALCDRAQAMEDATAQERREISDEILSAYEEVKDFLAANVGDEKT